MGRIKTDVERSITINGRFFNTAGPVKADLHYCLPPLERFNLAEVLTLIEQQKYFVLHAPRQTGKTTALLALMDHLNQAGHYHCLYINVEIAQAARENVRQGIRAILSEIASSVQIYLAEARLGTIWEEILTRSGEYGALNQLLTQWSIDSDKPIVLLIDEIDALVGDTLITVLRQLRAGYYKRPAAFPQSVVLCGVRDVRDYRIHSSDDITYVQDLGLIRTDRGQLTIANQIYQEVIPRELTYGTQLTITQQPL